MLWITTVFISSKPKTETEKRRKKQRLEKQEPISNSVCICLQHLFGFSFPQFFLFSFSFYLFLEDSFTVCANEWSRHSVLMIPNIFSTLSPFSWLKCLIFPFSMTMMDIQQSVWFFFFFFFFHWVLLGCVLLGIMLLHRVSINRNTFRDGVCALRCYTYTKIVWVPTRQAAAPHSTAASA